MVFTWADARLIPRAQYVSAETASTWLDEVRAMIEHHDWPSYNMTDTHADWRAFLANHPRCPEIIGLGAVHFEVHLLNVTPRNRARYAFLVRRVDGTDVWIRPQDRAVGWGRLEDWLPTETLAARSKSLYRFDPADMLAGPSPDISRNAIIAFLREQRHDSLVQCIIKLMKVHARSEDSTLLNS